MKSLIYFALQLILVAQLGYVSSSISHNSKSSIHKITLRQDPNDCNGALCMGHQYCERIEDQQPRCVNKLDLTQPCTGTGQCSPSNSECLGEPLTCSCTEKFVENDKQCVPTCTESSTCIGGAYCDSGVGGCLPQKDLNSPCTQGVGDDQCKTANATCEAESNACKCKLEFAEKDGQCIEKCNETSCGTIKYCDAEGLCQNKKYLGEECQETAQCLQAGSECSEPEPEKLCKCATGFVDYYGSCLAKCGTNDDCSTIPNQYCNLADQVCAPKANLNQGCSAFAGNVDQCLDANAECGSGICECKGTHVANNGVCQEKCTVGTRISCDTASEFCNTDSGLCQRKPILGEVCSTPNAECLGENVECNAETFRCSCSAGFVGLAGECKAKCTPEKNDCNTDTQFCSTDLGLCSPKLDLNGYCNIKDQNQCKTNFAACQEEEGGFGATCRCNSEYAQELGTSMCVLKCTSGSCASGKYCHASTGQCFNKVGLHSTCISEDGATQCQSENSDCLPKEETTDENTCQCKGDFLERDSMCIVPCKSSSDCNNPSAEYCETATGFCNGKVGLEQGCAYPDQCSAANAECVGDENDKKCACKTDYLPLGSTCRPKCTATSGCGSNEYCKVDTGLCVIKAPLHANCSETFECKTTAAECHPELKKCECGSAFLESGRNSCTAKCTTTTVCDFGAQFCNVDSGKCFNKSPIHGSCGDEGATQCLYDLTTCRKALPAAEIRTCECTDNAVEDNANNRCSCNSGFIESSDVKRCLKIATQTQETCEETSQCLNLGNGTAVSCSNGKCTCAANFIDSSDSKKCLKAASAIGDACEDPKQCTTLSGNADASSDTTTCTGSKCDCTSTSIKLEQKCFMRKVIGNSCANDKECTVGITGDVQCDSSKKCACTSNSVESADKKACTKKTSDSSAQVISINFIVLLLSSITVLKYWF